MLWFEHTILINFSLRFLPLVCKSDHHRFIFTFSHSFCVFVVVFRSVFPGSFSLYLWCSEWTDCGGERQQAQEGEFALFHCHVAANERPSLCEICCSHLTPTPFNFVTQHLWRDPNKGLKQC